MNLDLPQVGVSALLVIGHDGDLHHEGPDGSVVHVLERDDHPARRFGQLEHFDLLQVVEVGSCAHADLGRRVGLVELEVGVDGHVGQGRLPPELDVDQMGQLSVGLPVRVECAVSQLIDPESGFAGGEGPSGLIAHLPLTATIITTTRR